MTQRKIIPIAIATEGGEPDRCSEAEPYALMVLGDSMLPEFEDGEIIIIEPEGVARDGSFVIAYHNDEYIFRQLAIREERWYLQALNEGYPSTEIAGPGAIKGVITQKTRPGNRRASKFYR
jgi:SOS-response transcriptional repressor LexA